MAMKKKPIEGRDGLFPNFKRPKLYAVRDFPEGCGFRASSTLQIKCDEGDATKHSQNASEIKVDSLSVPLLDSLTVAANIESGKFHPGMIMKESSIKQDSPSCRMFVFPSESSDTHNSNSGAEEKLLVACINHDADALGNEQLKDDKKSQKYNVLIEDKEAIDSQEKVKEALNLFHKIVNKFFYDSKGKSEMQPHLSGGGYLKAARTLLEREKWINIPKRLGPIPGVQVGDKFQCRAELRVAGLHHQFFRGIDYMEKDGKILTTSVVNSGRYENNMISSGILIYSGQGGNPLIGFGHKKPIDQKLQHGNLALMNSKETGALVRVIYGFQISKNSSHIGLSGQKLKNNMYVYDGLYSVDDCWQERGQFGKLVFKFLLKRVLQQPKLDYAELINQLKSSKLKNDVVRDNDISQGKEKVPIRLKNLEDEEKPPAFDYITSVIYPKLFKPVLSNCCYCINGCGNFEICDCVLKSGGQMPYSSKGCNITCNPIIYECGPCCKCSSSCINRVTQNGIFLHLEVFKTKSKRWGVRSRSYIPKGSFLCEYVGEVLHDEEIQRRINNSYRKRLFEGGDVCLLTYPQVSTIPTENFTIDATLSGNVGRFINHSHSPNLYAQYVLYDHSDVKMAHIMLFAIKDVPPLQELTFDYSCTMAKFGL